MNPVVIGFGHKARRGKDTACSTIIKELGFRYDIRKYSFAEALKREVTDMGNQRTLCEMVNLPYDENPPMDDPLLPAPHGKQRPLLQWWGTEFRRTQDPDYWVKKTQARILAEQPQIAVLSDMRFFNEFAMVHAMNGYTVRMDRPGFELGTNMDHISERQLDDAPYDHVVTANDMDELRGSVMELINVIIDSEFPTL